MTGTSPVRLRLDVQYDGTDFHGWAVQPGLRTVNGVLTDALALVLRLPVPALSVIVAGRTDAGVHATGQVAHVDVPTEPDHARLVRALAGVLPADVRVTRVSSAPPGFDARFSALRRHYRYQVNDQASGVPPLMRTQVSHHPRPLDVDTMTEASTSLLGLHDFAAFCRPRDRPTGMATTIRTLERFVWSRDESGVVRAEVSADAFCHSMVRALVGCLLPVGDGRRDAQWPITVLAAQRRDPAVTVAPAHGLTLVRVDYPDDAELAVRAVAARVARSLADASQPPG